MATAVESDARDRYHEAEAAAGGRHLAADSTASR